MSWRCGRENVDCWCSFILLINKEFWYIIYMYIYSDIKFLMKRDFN